MSSGRPISSALSASARTSQLLARGRAKGFFLTTAERQMLWDLSEAIDNRTDLGDGDRKERALWKRASNMCSRIAARSVRMEKV